MKIDRVIIYLTVTSIPIAAILFWFSRNLAERFDSGVLRTTYQFLLLVVAGGAISWFYREIDRTRQVRKEARQELLTLHAQLVASYNEYKKIKRLLRAVAWKSNRDDSSSDGVLLISEYVPLLRSLNDVQLTFEGYKRMPLASNVLVERCQAKQIMESLGIVEKYLNKVVGEFESSLRDLGSDDVVQLSNMRHTSEFVGPGGESSHRRDNASECFRRSIDLLSQITA